MWTSQYRLEKSISYCCCSQVDLPLTVLTSSKPDAPHLHICSLEILPRHLSWVEVRTLTSRQCIFLKSFSSRVTFLLWALSCCTDFMTQFSRFTFHIMVLALQIAGTRGNHTWNWYRPSGMSFKVGYNSWPNFHDVGADASMNGCLCVSAVTDGWSASTRPT